VIKPLVRARVVCLAASLVAVMVTARPVDAQRSERQQEVQMPGIGISLKAGWQLRIYDGCRFAVPRFWHATADGSSVAGPDGSNLSVRAYRIKSWSDHKAQIKRAFGRVNVVHEDSERLLWFEIGDRPRVQHYIDVVNGLTSCTGLLEIRAATTLSAEAVNTIAKSIGPAPAHWPPDAIK
jgi:hypothetical protein